MTLISAVGKETLAFFEKSFYNKKYLTNKCFFVIMQAGNHKGIKHYVSKSQQTPEVVQLRGFFHAEMRE